MQGVQAVSARAADSRLTAVSARPTAKANCASSCSAAGSSGTAQIAARVLADLKLLETPCARARGASSLLRGPALA
eukprot:264015-Pyramimonas_sp.AAC.1